MPIFDTSRLQSKLSFHAALKSIISKYSRKASAGAGGDNHGSSRLARSSRHHDHRNADENPDDISMDEDEDDDDIIDLKTMRIIKDRGKLESMDATPFGSFIQKTPQEIIEERSLRKSLRGKDGQDGDDDDADDADDVDDSNSSDVSNDSFQFVTLGSSGNEENEDKDIPSNDDDDHLYPCQHNHHPSNLSLKSEDHIHPSILSYGRYLNDDSMWVSPAAVTIMPALGDEKEKEAPSLDPSSTRPAKTKKASNNGNSLKRQTINKGKAKELESRAKQDRLKALSILQRSLNQDKHQYEKDLMEKDLSSTTNSSSNSSSSSSNCTSSHHMHLIVKEAGIRTKVHSPKLPNKENKEIQCLNSAPTTATATSSIPLHPIQASSKLSSSSSEASLSAVTTASILLPSPKSNAMPVSIPEPAQTMNSDKVTDAPPIPPSASSKPASSSGAKKGKSQQQQPRKRNRPVAFKMANKRATLMKEREQFILKLRSTDGNDESDDSIVVVKEGNPVLHNMEESSKPDRNNPNDGHDDIDYDDDDDDFMSLPKIKKRQ